MAWSFGDGFDLYAAGADMDDGYWDSITGTAANITFVAGRFSGSRAAAISGTGTSVNKSSATNDAVHHFAVAFQQTAAITGSTLAGYLQLLDGATAQCSVVFRSDGAILLTSGIATGTVLATYAGAFPVVNTWYHFEIEVVINNTTGSFKVRKNGNSTDDHSTTGLNTRASANNYANAMKWGQQANITSQYFDDLFWRSDASSVAWLGDIRCYTRMPASDASVTWSRTPSAAYPLFPIGSFGTPTVNNARYTPFTPGNSGSVGTVTMQMNTGSTANFKCTIYSDNAGTPGTVLGSATPVSAPGASSTATFTFGTPVSVTAGTKYWIAIVSDATSGQIHSPPSGHPGFTAGLAWNAATYASFPTNNPTITTTNIAAYSLGIGVTPAVNYPYVAEAQQDALTSYVYSSTVNDADLYGIATIASTPATVIATTARAYMQKSDAGTRTAAVQVKSGSTTVASSTLTLTTSGWQWAWRTDLTDPATGTAWTAAAVNAATIGPKVIA